MKLKKYHETSLQAAEVEDLIFNRPLQNLSQYKKPFLNHLILKFIVDKVTLNRFSNAFLLRNLTNIDCVSRA